MNPNILWNICVMSVLYVMYYTQPILQQILTNTTVAELSSRLFVIHWHNDRCCTTAFSTLLCYKLLIFLVLVQKPLIAVFQLKLRLVVEIVWVCLDLDCIYTLFTLYLTIVTRLSLSSATRRGINVAIRSDFEAKSTNLAFSSACLDYILSYFKSKIQDGNYCSMNRNILWNICVMSVLYVMYYTQPILQQILTTAVLSSRRLLQWPQVPRSATTFSTLFVLQISYFCCVGLKTIDC